MFQNGGQQRRTASRGAAQRQSSASHSRQAAAPYSRPSASGNAASVADAYPPSQLSIRGASSLPTQVLVSNLANGTSTEDVRQTFLQYGEIIRVRQRSTHASNSVAYEVLFEDKSGAKAAVEQLNGALADGRVLSVKIETDSAQTSAQGPAASSTTTTAGAGAAPPTGPRAAMGRANGGGRGASNGGGRGGAAEPRELITPAAAVRKAGAAAGAAIPKGPAITAKDRKAMINAVKQSVAASSIAGAPKGPRNAKGSGAGVAVAPSLQSRLGGLPLAQRLGGVKGAAAAGKGSPGAKSDLSSLEANKSKRALQREKAQAKAAASGAAANAIAAPGVPGQGASASAKKKRKAKAKNAAGAVAGNGGMELD